MSKIKLKVDGMTCEHCARRVKQALENAQGVSKVKVNLKKGEAAVTGENLDTSTLTAAVKEAGYSATPE